MVYLLDAHEKKAMRQFGKEGKLTHLTNLLGFVAAIQKRTGEKAPDKTMLGQKRSIL